MVIGGGGEIRTLGGLSPSLVFKTSAFNRSATPPRDLHSTLPDYLGNADRSSGANCRTAESGSYSDSLSGTKSH